MTPHKVFLLLLTATLAFQCSHSEELEDAPDFSDYMALSLEERQQPEHATEAFAVAEGLEARLFASETMVINPTNMAIDERGRVWVCESYNYAVPEAEQKESGGRIIILEDTDGDGAADERKVFYQGDDVNIALGISVFGNRVFVARSPNLLVFTDEDGDDVPDKKEVLFTGMGGPGDHSAHAVVFGPDGRFYFNYGNAGIKVLSAGGDTIRDQSGHLVYSNGHPFHGGMVFRFDQDGSNFEVLGHNFRNNYEVTIDAYGNLWQSDNDDDGNKGVRINYVMEYGNFGYLDELTGAHWTAPRTGMHEDIPQRHWHQNDPGVVPNLLYTGAGSPAGITIYEGDLLPSVFQGQIIHADAGPNVVRAYPVVANGAGYQARSEDIVRSVKDQWFRPVDVAVAPDGSLFIADWYDPIVGGGAAGDHEKGRIFRVAPPGDRYEVETVQYSDPVTAAGQLSNPNEAIRYLAWQSLHSAGVKGEPALKQLWGRASGPVKARTLWLLGQLPNGRTYLEEATQDEDEQIRVVAVRLARQMNVDLLPFIRSLSQDASAAVRRELAIALRYEEGPEAASLWADLALQHDGQDRWYLEALGIGAERHWSDCFDAWRSRVEEDWTNLAARDIVWRSRAEAAIPLLAQLILDPQTDAKERRRYFRAFDFHQQTSKNEFLLSLLEADHPDQEDIRALALQHLDAGAVAMSPNLKAAIDETLETIAGSWQYVDLIAKFKLSDKKGELLNLAVQADEDGIGANAARLLIDPQGFNGADLIRQRIHDNESDGHNLLRAMQSIGSKASLDLLQNIVLDDQLQLKLRKTAVQAMGQTWWGEDYLLETVKREKFHASLKPLAASILFSVYRTSIHEEAAKYLERPGSIEQEALPPIRVLVATDGNVDRGREVFKTYCHTCHTVQGEGIAFGPDLSLIGDKLSPEGLYRAIIYPSEGINYGYETHQLTLKSEGVAVGLLASETDEQIDLKMIGGAIQSYEKAAIAKREILPNSLMTNLSLAMEQEALIDLVNYLGTLREGQNARLLH